MENPRPHLRADGNLTYLQFIDLVAYLWDLSHPDIPFVPAGNADPAKYPSIVYSLQLTKTHPSEPKPQFREFIDKDADELYQIVAQRFQNVVTFSAVTEAGNDPDTNLDDTWQPARLAEELLDAFEDFMLEFTPIFKRRGLSEIVYARRMPDREETRPGAGTIVRTTSYMITTEKIVVTLAEKLRRVDLDVRRHFSDPRYFFITNGDNTIDIYGQTLKIGDLIMIHYDIGAHNPSEFAAYDEYPTETKPRLMPAVYRISNIVMVGENMRYYLSKNGEPVEGFDSGMIGHITLVGDDVYTDIYDQFGSATPDQDFS